MPEQSTLSDDLCTTAELKAVQAEELLAFSGFKLQHVKRELAIMLSLIGRDGLFDQYTRHDITHINSLLLMLDWVIPIETQNILTPADWLLLTLAIYFHDFGMLVTKKEYELRHASEFPEFKASVTSNSSSGKDLKAKLARLTPDDAERFLFQEYIRTNHARRIRQWIQGRELDLNGQSQAIAKAIDGLMAKLPDPFRRDLALVCESHHLDDLNDVSKYRTSQPYGNSGQSTANVQYAAIVLRTVDLLHMTTDRTPSIAFHLISPSDPISQREWAKQGAVRNVRAKAARNKDNILDPSLPMDTVEVFALFKDPEGFFALTEFLVYVRKQLKVNAEWIKTSQLREGAESYMLHWRNIDEANVEADGFLSNRFEFQIDHNKVLDLLTGHTLYNDTGVVLRELLQNAIDAVRVQKLIQPTYVGRVDVRWRSAENLLEIQDDGTGMTQSIIESHLLKVGSSRYQEQSFARKFPSFSPISRFGIGLLSCFMVADQVDIITCHPEEPLARHLSLRTVHGRYLIRVLNKASNEIKPIGPHGTLVRLVIRSSATLKDVHKTVRRWIVTPACGVYLSLDSSPPVPIGHTRLGDALKEAMREEGLDVDADRPASRKKIKIEEAQIGGVTIAFALRWSEWFKEWGFIEVRRQDDDDDDVDGIQLGTCIEGVRVEFATPGFSGPAIFAMANATGIEAPKTNVARSAFEAGPELLRMLSHIYNAYTNQVASESARLMSEEQFSVTWATREAAFLLDPLLSHIARASSRLTFIRVASTIPLFLVEVKDERQAISVTDLRNYEHIWTAESELIRSAESLIGEASSTGSINLLTRVMPGAALSPVPQPMLCRAEQGHLRETFLADWEVDRIVVKGSERRLDLRWSVAATTTADKRWAELPTSPGRRLRRPNAFGLGLTAERMPIYANRGIELEGITDEIGVKSLRGVFLRGGTEFNTYLISMMPHLHQEGVERRDPLYAILAELISDLLNSGMSDANISRMKMSANQYAADLNSPPFVEFFRIVAGTSFRLFDPNVWVRKVSNHL